MQLSHLILNFTAVFSRNRWDLLINSKGGNMELFYLITAYVLAGVFGLCVGSFLNVVIYRVPNNMSLAKPDSHCPVCKYQLRWYDNIPILSYLMLGGKCRSCKTHISFRYTAASQCASFLGNEYSPCLHIRARFFCVYLRILHRP